MPVHAFLDLSGPISLRDLQRLLEYVPEGADLDRDIRWNDVDTQTVRYLGLGALVGRPPLPTKE